MAAARLNLLVLRSADMERLASFYSALGIKFERHRHGKGPEHLSGDTGSLVLEIYPTAENASCWPEPRIGFSVADMSETMTALESIGIETQSQPKSSPWGLRAVVRDFDGRKVELLEAESS